MGSEIANFRFWQLAPLKAEIARIVEQVAVVPEAHFRTMIDGMVPFWKGSQPRSLQKGEDLAWSLARVLGTLQGSCQGKAAALVAAA